jgi:hypothetical protein
MTFSGYYYLTQLKFLGLSIPPEMGFSPNYKPGRGREVLHETGLFSFNELGMKFYTQARNSRHWSEISYTGTKFITLDGKSMGNRHHITRVAS